MHLEIQPKEICCHTLCQKQKERYSLSNNNLDGKMFESKSLIHTTVHNVIDRSNMVISVSIIIHTTLHNVIDRNNMVISVFIR